MDELFLAEIQNRSAEESCCPSSVRILKASDILPPNLTDSAEPQQNNNKPTKNVEGKVKVS